MLSIISHFRYHFFWKLPFISQKYIRCSLSLFYNLLNLFITSLLRMVKKAGHWVRWLGFKDLIHIQVLHRYIIYFVNENLLSYNKNNTYDGDRVLWDLNEMIYPKYLVQSSILWCNYYSPMQSLLIPKVWQPNLFQSIKRSIS